MTTKTKSTQKEVAKPSLEKFAWLCLFVTILSCVTIICLKDMYVASVANQPVGNSCTCEPCPCDQLIPHGQNQVEVEPDLPEYEHPENCFDPVFPDQNFPES